MSHFAMSKKVTLAVLAGSLLTLSSCSKDGGGSTPPPVSSNNIEIQNDTDGVYRAFLRPLNQHVAGHTSGTVTIHLAGDEMVIEEAIAGAPQGVRHFQFITSGDACPDEAADVNADTYIDAMEAQLIYGKALIPIDSNLNSQIDGSDFGPLADPAGNIVFRRSASVSMMLADLNEEDPATDDHLAKLAGNRMVLSGKRVVIHGVSVSLPDTVAGMGERSAAESLPIACGEILRVSGDEEPTDLPEVL